MSSYNFDQLQTAIGTNIRLIPCPATQKTFIQWADGEDIAVIDFEQGRIETHLTATWDEKDLAVMPNGEPDAKAIANARQEIVEELLYDWELAGFTAPNGGALEWQSVPDQPSRKQPIYVVVATKSVPTLADATETIRMIVEFGCGTTTAA